MVAWCVLVTVGTKSGLGYLRIWVQQHWCGVKGCRQADRQRNVQKQNAELESKEKLKLKTNKHTHSHPARPNFNQNLCLPNIEKE